MSDIGKYIDEILPQIRGKFGMENELNDDKAKDIIIDVAFKSEIIKNLDVSTIDSIVKSIFYKTRRRLGILEPLIEDNEISEIMANGPNDIFYEKRGKIFRYGLCFESVEELEEVMRNIAADVHREFNELNPIVDARLADGSRVNLVYKNVAINGPILTIRKFSDGYMRLEDLENNLTLNHEGAILLKALVESGYNIFVSGGTSSGKTTLLNALAEAIPKNERVIVIEDSMELKLPYIENIVHMECRSKNSQGFGQVNMAALIKSSLRMRPDRIVVGEVRGAEVVEMLQAMNTGHQGSLSTGHGNSVPGMLKRLETMYLMAMPVEIDAIRSQIAEGLDIMIHLSKLEDGKRRIIEITEVLGYLNGKYELNEIMRYDVKSDELNHVGKLKNTAKLMLYGGRKTDEIRRTSFVE